MHPTPKPPNGAHTHTHTNTEPVVCAVVTGDILIRETLGDASFVHVLADPCKCPAEIRDLLALLQSEGSLFFFSLEREKVH